MNRSENKEQHVVSKAISVLELDPSYSVKMSPDDAAHIRAVGRILSGFRNMPMAFWTNTSTGVNTGFFMHTLFDSWKDFDAYVEESGINELPANCDTGYKEGEFDYASAFEKLINLLKAHDPQKEYCYYHFGTMPV